MSHTTGYMLQQAFNILQLAGFYLPLALAFAIVQAITRRIFLSFGDLAMFGSFAAVYVCFDSMLWGNSDFSSALLSLAAAIACGAAIGVVVARVFLGSSLLKTPLAFMIASVGLSIVLEEAIRLQSQSRDIWVPPLFSGQSLLFLQGSYPVKFSAMAGFALAASVVAVICVVGVLHYSHFGRSWRACAQSLKLSALCGIDVVQVSAVSFAIAGALSSITGWTSSISFGGANFAVGLMVGFKAMFASVIGGFGTLRGACLGAVVLASMEVVWSAAFSTAYRDVAVFVVIVMVLILRPQGLLGISSFRESEVE
jgi:branched-chain amino acid transport system permease protein